LSSCSTMSQCHTNSPSTSNRPRTLVTSPGTGDERVVRNRSAQLLVELAGTLNHTQSPSVPPRSLESRVSQ
jgi:hypothetical protein